MTISCLAKGNFIANILHILYTQLIDGIMLSIMWQMYSLIIN